MPNRRSNASPWSLWIGERRCIGHLFQSGTKSILDVGGHSATSFLSRARPRDASDFTAPGRHLSAVAISASDQPPPVPKDEHSTLSVWQLEQNVNHLRSAQ